MSLSHSWTPGYFQFGARMNKSAMNILIKVFLRYEFSFSLIRVADLLGHRLGVCSINKPFSDVDILFCTLTKDLRKQ